MKSFILIALIFLKISFVAGQRQTINDLKIRLHTTVVDTEKTAILDSLSNYYLFFTNKPDSSFYYINESINYTFNFNNKKYLILAYARMGFYYLNTSQYKAAVDISLKGLKLSEQYNIRDYLATFYYTISFVYYNLGDFSSGLRNAFDGINDLKSSTDPFYDQAVHIFGLTGNIYLDGGKPDSSFYFFNRMDSFASVSKELSARDVANWYWSIYYLNSGNYLKADSIIAVGIASCQKNGDFLLGFFNVFLAQSYLNQGKISKAIISGNSALVFAKSIDDIGGLRSSASLLQVCYEKLGNNDSAYHYLKMSDSLGAFILSKGSLNEIQQTKFEEQLSQREDEANQILQNEKTRSKIVKYIFITAFLFFVIIVGIQWRNNKHRKKANALLQQQKDKVETTLSELKSTQSQLIQSEKMASLGELTAGIAHEIQNPLNFVNNFSEVNTELIDELEQEADKGNMDEVKVIAKDIKENSERINHHGKRAGDIVKGMLQHSQKSTGVKEPTNINALADEYLRLSYHGLRAKDKGFNATMKTNFDESIGKINIIPQDIGRVLLNLFNNAFYAVNEQKSENLISYEPTVSVTTKKTENSVLITVTDNGNGIPQNIVDKIFQPFFTTKPTGQGTGLGLSLSYDILKAHGGEVKVESKEGEGTKFIIELAV